MVFRIWRDLAKLFHPVLQVSLDFQRANSSLISSISLNIVAFQVNAD
jgi:hypothetical protein